jgi:hypothetical protein
MTSIANSAITQEQMFYQAQRRVADANEIFLELVTTGLTCEELQRNIERRPALWSRYANWLPVLPSSAVPMTLSH